MSGMCLLVINAPRSLEATLIDWLLADDPRRGFTSMRVSGHHTADGAMNTVELVTGHVRRSCFEIEIPVEESAAILERLRAEFGNADLHFRRVPLLDAGSLDEAAGGPE